MSQAVKRVLLFANSTWCLHNFRRNLMAALLSEGFEVHVLTPLDPTYDNNTFLKAFADLGVIFHELPMQPRGLNPLREVLLIFRLFYKLRQIKPEVVLSYTVKCNLYAGFCRQLLRFRQVANVPGLGEVFEKKSFLYLLVSFLYRAAFRGVSHAFFQNSEDLQYCLKAGLVPKERCFLIPGSGVDLERFVPMAKPPECRQRVFLMFGRVLPQKGYREYLQAARELKQILGDKVQCWVMGIEDKNREESKAIYQKLVAADREGIIRLIPAQVDVVPIIKQVDVVVLPSRYNEGVPRSLLEAMAMGKAIITTDWRGCRETVEHEKNGYLIPVLEGNNMTQGALTQAMLKMAELDEDTLRSFGSHSRKLSEGRYDEHIVVEEYLQVVNGVTLNRQLTANNKLLSPGQNVEHHKPIKSHPLSAGNPQVSQTQLHQFVRNESYETIIPGDKL